MKTGLLVLLAVALIILLMVFFFAGDQGHMWGSEGRMHFGAGYMWILLLIVIGLAVYLVIESQKSRTDGGKETPLEILKTRFARGEITKEEFEEMKRKLEE
ncbi:MAG: SHOCT domain-containing protein [Candidatus Zixiibacteriota bacterium]